MTHTIEPLLQPVMIAHLRPTQMTVGMREVSLKRKAWRARRDTEGGAFLGLHMIPVVLGPDKRFWIIDHHHLVLALAKEEVEEVLVNRIADLATLKKTEFLTFMSNRNWLHPYDDTGRRRTLKHMPKHISELVDDPYRSLAGEARRGGAYAKVETPYAEFLWADFFRGRIGRRLVEDDFAGALKEAMALSHDNAAQHLPGYVTSR